VGKSGLYAEIHHNPNKLQGGAKQILAPGTCVSSHTTAEVTPHVCATGGATLGNGRENAPTISLYVKTNSKKPIA